MDSLRRPVGTLPPSVYWRRRLLVLVVLLAVLALILYACSDSGPSKKKGGASQPVASGTATTTVSGGAAGGTTGGATTGGASSPAGTTGGTSTGGTTSGGTTGGTTTGGSSAPAPGSTPTAGTLGGTTTTGGTVPGGTCQLALTLTSRAAAYSNGEKPDFSVAVLNKGTVDCTADLGQKSLVLTIFSGPDRIWSSADCDGSQDLRAIPPGGLVQIPFTWKRVRSQPGCAGPAADAALGTYNATASLATGTGPTAAAFNSQSQSFQLKTGS